MKVQIAATEKAIATIHSQMFVSFSFILFDYSVAIIPRFKSVPAVMALRVEARRFTRLRWHQLVQLFLCRLVAWAVK